MHIVLVVEIDDSKYDFDKIHGVLTKMELVDYTTIHNIDVTVKYAKEFKEGEALHWRKDTAHRNLIHYTNLDESDI